MKNWVAIGEILADARMKSRLRLDEIKSVLLLRSSFHRVSDFIHASGFRPSEGRI